MLLDYSFDPPELRRRESGQPEVVAQVDQVDRRGVRDPRGPRYPAFTDQTADALERRVLAQWKAEDLFRQVLASPPRREEAEVEVVMSLPIRVG